MATLQMMFQTIVLSLIAISVWWAWRVGRFIPVGRFCAVWRAGLYLFVLAMAFIPIAGSKSGFRFPAALMAMALIWHVLVVPLTMLVWIVLDLPRFVGRLIVGKRTIAGAIALADQLPDPGRRRFLGMAAAVAPPLLVGGLTAAALDQRGEFRVREVDVPVDGWPAELNGFTIAMVADVHTGPFTTPAMLADIVAKTNTIHRGGPADLVVLGGDLINSTLRDLPAGLGMATALRGRLGTVAILGNHDVMDNVVEFYRGFARTDIPLLIDECMTIEPAPGIGVELLGVSWQMGDDDLFSAVGRTAAKRNTSLFPICLAHHPHCWDEAIRQGLPLVLSGHTHGGQIMLTENIGGGPLKFRYWSGVHRRNGSTLVISNGVGNWFPLRVNAPAELLKITLHANT